MKKKAGVRNCYVNIIYLSCTQPKMCPISCESVISSKAHFFVCTVKGSPSLKESRFVVFLNQMVNKKINLL